MIGLCACPDGAAAARPQWRCCSTASCPPAATTACSLPPPARALARSCAPSLPSRTLLDPPGPSRTSRTLPYPRYIQLCFKKIYFLSNIEVLEDNVDEREPDTGPAAAKDGTEVNQNGRNSRYKRKTSLELGSKARSSLGLG